MNPFRVVSMTCIGILIVASSVVAQRRAPGAQKPTVGVTIALKAGADAYAFTGQANCTHAPMASIYGVVAEQWTVEQSEGQRSVHLTLWKPKSGSGEMFSLGVSTGGSSHAVNTVKAEGASPTKGSGTTTFAPSGGGGTFTINAKAADGTTIAGTIKCDAFLPAMAEGGD